ncbi:MAG: transporter associated domain-containing protein, partial [Halobacteria archaeon]|nr:transporter associated domain-containing protein [Halobacteria archaeon]
IDEFGSTQGLVTIEDIVEEIVGEIFETEEEEPIERMDDNTIAVKGEVNVDEVNEVLNINLPEEGEFETVAGFIYNRMGRLVEEDETIEYDDVVLTVREIDNTRILWVEVEKMDENQEDEVDEGKSEDDEET